MNLINNQISICEAWLAKVCKLTKNINVAYETS